MGLFADKPEDDIEKFDEKLRKPKFDEKLRKPDENSEDGGEGDFQVPVKRVKSIHRPKIVKVPYEKNRFEKLQDIVQKSGVNDNSMQPACTDGHSIDNEMEARHLSCVLNSTTDLSNYARKKVKYARRTARRREKAFIVQS